MSKYTLKEQDICAEFGKTASSQGWSVYPETGGWDQLMMWENETTNLYADKPHLGEFIVEKNTQIGIQAKARPNFVVIRQTLEYRKAKLRPHYTAVLVPKFVDGFEMVCRECGIIPFTHELKPDELIHRIKSGKFEKRKGDGLIWTPSIIPDLPAGVSGPKSLTKWKSGALSLSWLLRNRGYVTSVDFPTFGNDITLWRRSNWIKRDGTAMVEKNGYMVGVAKYTMGTNTSSDSDTLFPDIGWEDIRDLIAIEKGLSNL
jgi:hypothetical protein